MIRFTTLLVGFILSLSFFSACDKSDLVRDGDFQLEFSEDTIYFDTVMVTLGSVTQYFQIYNRNDDVVELETIGLAVGEKSFFRLNLNGEKGKTFSKVKIPARDSLFMFVEVTIDPLDENNPLLIKDSIIFQSKTGTQDIKLQAYGQDAHVFRSEVIKSQTWTKDKPYLIVNSAAVDSNEVLTIEAGTQIFLTNTSSLVVWGRVEAHGTYEEPILFTGSRFDGRYAESAGQWRTIFFDQKSTGNILEHVIIRNATAGIQIGYPGEETISDLELINCQILNSSSIGIYAFNGTINAYNTIIADCGAIAILAQMGGTYNFYHCTISNISAYFPGSFIRGGYKSRSLPSVIYTNYFNWYDLDLDYRIIDVTYPIDLELNFVNSIINGTKASEVFYDSLSSAMLEYSFDHCLLKMHEDSVAYFDTNKFISVIFNEDPAFINDSVSIADYNFELDSNSAAVNMGSLERIEGIPQLEFDLKGNPRKEDGLPDLGAYERIK